MKEPGQFPDPAVERDFQEAGRAARIPWVRLYTAVVGAVLLVYAAVNPLFFDAGELVRFSLLLLPSFVVLGGYCALTFWRNYTATPMVDFVCLLALGMILAHDSSILFDEMNRQDDSLYASVGINGLIAAAFAAFALAGRFRWFLVWTAVHAVGFNNLMLVLGVSVEAWLYQLMSHLAGAGVMLFLNWALGRAYRNAYRLHAELERERAKTEELLYNVLPEAAVKRIKDGQVVADAYSDASVVFIDVVGFTKLAGTVSPGHLIEMLNGFFNLADRCAAEHGVEKVKTIGDAYLAVAGGNVSVANSADAALAFAKGVIAGLDAVRDETGLPLQVRVGIHSGPVVGGVIGATRMAYDYWGETMNMAARLEGQAEPDGIAVSESTFLRTRRKELFALPERVVLKGVGEVAVYRVKPAAALPLALAG